MGTTLNKFLEYIESHMVIFMDTFVYPIQKEAPLKQLEVHDTEFI